MSPTAVLERVAKLLALAGSSNVHEAAAAAARAQALIEAHRLEDWLTDDQTAVDPITDARDEPLETFRKLRRWKTVLAAELAHANGCVAYTLQRPGEQDLVLIGRERDRMAVKTLYDALVVQLEWLSATHGPGQSKKWHDSFRIGAARRIAERLQAVEAPTESMALAVVRTKRAEHQRALQTVVAERLGTGKSKSLRVFTDAWVAGQAASDDVPLPS